jgi:hypothetical protein
MHKSFLMVLTCIVGLAAAAGSADLYKVMVTGPQDALRLNEARVEPVAPVLGGYLVLTDPATRAGLEAVGIKLILVTADISADELAVDLRLDAANTGRYSAVYQEDALRLYRVDRSLWKDAADLTVMPAKNDHLKIEFRPSPVFDKTRLDLIDLQGLIAQVSQDSLYSYTSTLQAQGDRYAGSTSSHISRDWLAGKFASFGYDSVVIDSFVTSVPCQNVLAFKLGTVMPDHYIVVGAHRDAVSGSPGADDNGSGSAGVLEIARILKNINTDLTFVFALFDSEEQGLNGSEHYANEAKARGDSIVYMFNMDMIANEGNSTQAKLYHGSVLTYTELLQHLADSLVGISAVLSGSSGGSDHYPFLQNGYEATFLHEYIFSSVYHSYRDSTTHMTFPYFTKMVRAGLATVYSISEKYVPGPRVAFDYPDGVPSEVTPGSTTPLRVVVSGLYGGTPVQGSGRLHYSINGGVTVETSMSEPFPNQYQAILPALSCGDLLAFYFSAEEVDSGVFYNPDPADPFTAVPVTGDSVVFSDNFEQNLGWTTTGAWQRGSPTGGGGAYGGPDPVGGHNSSNCYGYNLSGDYPNSMTAAMPLTSPVINCQGIFGVHLQFWRWLGVEQAIYDHAAVQVSANGTTWTTVWENVETIADSSWKLQELDISAIADNQPTVYLRWTIGPTDVAWTYCGWNIDDVQVGGYTCNSALQIITTSLPDWTAGHPYSQQLQSSGGTSPYSWVDKFGDLSGTGLTLSATGLLFGIPSMPGPISFTAQVTDDQSNVVDKAFNFTINAALVITTLSLPDATLGQPYSQQLTSTGGTGNVTWTDKEGALVGTGLTLSGSGLLNGTPATTGPVAFAARVTDAVGGSDEELLAFAIKPSYVCGDATADGNINIADAVYIVGYIFRGGPAPAPLEAGDANCEGAVNVGDAVYLVNYIFRGGPAPCCP